MEEHYIDRRVREELEGLEANPPVEAWAEISDALALRRKRSVRYMLSGIAASVAMLAVSVLTYWLLTDRVDTIPGAYSETQMPQAISPVAPALTVSSPGIIMNPGAERPEISTSGYLFASLGEDVLQPADDNSLALLTVDLPERYPVTELMAQYPSGSFSGSVNKPYTERIYDFFAAFSSNEPHKFRVGAHFSPQSSYRVYSGGVGPAYEDIPYGALEEAMLTMGAGISGYYNFAPGWTLQTGLNYFRTGQYIRDIVSYNHPSSLPLYGQERTTGRVLHPQTILTSQGSVALFDQYHYFADVQSSRVITSKEGLEGTEIRTLKRSGEGISQVFSYIEMPVVFRYHILRRGGIDLHVKGGMSGTYLIGNDVYLGRNIYQNPVGETFGVREINFSAIGGFSVELPLTNRLYLHIEPTAQLFLNPVLREGFMMGHAYPFGYSLVTGISYGF